MLSLGCIELMLRAQDSWGPIVQLSGFTHSIDLYSPTVHHRSSKKKTVTIAGPGPCGDQRVRVLFLGDSWIEQDGVIEGFAHQLDTTGESGDCYELLNGGISSYSPSLILLHGTALIEEHAPDIVFVNIDETDLMDETLRYAYSSVHDNEGKLIAVVPSLPDVPTITFDFGFIALERQPSYVLRLLEKAYFTLVFMPRLRASYDRIFPEPSYEHLFGPQLSKRPRVEYAAAIDRFRKRLSAMIAGLEAALGNDGRLVLTHHPHFLHVAGPDAARYNTVVGDLLKEAVARHDVRLYDAMADYSSIHEDTPDNVFAWPDDIFSHLTYRGYFSYGERIASVHAELLRTVAQIEPPRRIPAPRRSQ